MKYTLTITMNYVGLLGNPDGSVTEIVDADLTNMKFSVNNDESRDVGQITGAIRFSDKYDEFGLYLNDKTGYYIDPANYSYTLVKNGVSLNTGTIIESGNNIVDKVLTFTLSKDVADEYQNIYNNADVEYNIIPAVSGASNTTEYRDFRTLDNTRNTTDLSVTITGQGSLQAYIDGKIIEDDEWIARNFTFTPTFPGLFVLWDVAINWHQFWALGYVNDGNNEPPAGINWIYDSIVGGKPKYVKRPLYTTINYGNYLVSSITPATVTTEQEADIDYALVARDYDDVIEYLVTQADPNIVFDGDSFAQVGFLSGEIYSGNDDAFKYMKLIALSDFVPDNEGNQKNVLATKGMISFNTIMNYFLSLGFYWYLELDTGDYYFRMSHIIKKVLGSSNPDLTDYFNKDRLFRTKNVTVIEPEFDKIDNSTQSSGYNFRLPTYTFRAGTKSKSFSETRIITDPDYVVDGKGSAFDETSNDQWVLLSTYFNTPNYEIRYINSALTDIITNNYELSFYWLTLNLFEMPGKVGADTTVFDDTRVTKRNQVELSLPVDGSVFSDFTIYDYIAYFGQEAEIINLDQGALDNILNMTMRYL